MTNLFKLFVYRLRIRLLRDVRQVLVWRTQLVDAKLRHPAQTSRFDTLIAICDGEIKRRVRNMPASDSATWIAGAVTLSESLARNESLSKAAGEQIFGRDWRQTYLPHTKGEPLVLTFGEIATPEQLGLTLICQLFFDRFGLDLDDEIARLPEELRETSLMFTVFYLGWYFQWLVAYLHGDDVHDRMMTEAKISLLRANAVESGRGDEWLKGMEVMFGQLDRARDRIGSTVGEGEVPSSVRATLGPAMDLKVPPLMLAAAGLYATYEPGSAQHHLSRGEALFVFADMLTAALSQRGQSITNAVHALHMDAPLTWSAQPAARERHLQRRVRNSLFLPARRIVSQGEIDRAREMDNAEAAALKTEALAYINANVIDRGAVQVGELTASRTFMQDVLLKAAWLGGGVGRELQNYLQPLLDAINTDTHAAMTSASVPQNLQDEYLAQDKVFEQMQADALGFSITQRDDIPDGERVAAMLTEPIAVLRWTLGIVEDTKKSAVVMEARDLLTAAHLRLADDPTLSPLPEYEAKSSLIDDLYRSLSSVSPLPDPPDAALQRISAALGRQKTPDECLSELLAGSSGYDTSVLALVDYCLAKPDLRDVISEFSVTRATIEELFSQLLASGAGGWANGHYVPASAVAQPRTLRFLLEKHRGNLDDPLNKSFLIFRYFDVGTPLESTDVLRPVSGTNS